MKNKNVKNNKNLQIIKIKTEKKLNLSYKNAYKSKLEQTKCKNDAFVSNALKIFCLKAKNSLKCQLSVWYRTLALPVQRVPLTPTHG